VELPTAPTQPVRTQNGRKRGSNQVSLPDARTAAEDRKKGSGHQRFPYLISALMGVPKTVEAKSSRKGRAMNQIQHLLPRSVKAFGSVSRSGPMELIGVVRRKSVTASQNPKEFFDTFVHSKIKLMVAGKKAPQVI
jgi:hypothetical protein